VVSFTVGVGGGADGPLSINLVILQVAATPSSQKGGGKTLPPPPVEAQQLRLPREQMD
jgi:hypothetical protein